MPIAGQLLKELKYYLTLLSFRSFNGKVMGLSTDQFGNYKFKFLLTHHRKGESLWAGIFSSELGINGFLV